MPSNWPSNWDLACIAAAGAAILATGLVLSTPPTLAQAAGFRAVSVSATQSGNTGFAWIVGADGSTRFCTNGTGSVTCSPVHY